MDLIPSGLADVVSTPLPYQASILFTYPDRPKSRGQLFIMLRPVVDRAISYYYWIKLATWDANHDPEIAEMSLMEYAGIQRDRPEFNWLTKTLAGKTGEDTGDLTTADLNVAKEVLKRKAAIGLLTHKGDSLLRFEKYFGWMFEGAASKTCEEELLHWEWSRKGAPAQQHEVMESGNPIYKTLERRNSYDAELYRYAERLFFDQELIFHGGRN